MEHTEDNASLLGKDLGYVSCINEDIYANNSPSYTMEESIIQLSVK